MTDLPSLYTDLAAWWPLLSPPDEYAEEAATYHESLTRAVTGTLRTLLELGSGGGSNAFHLQRHYRLTLTDPSPGMLAVSRRVNPACEHVEGDMRTLRLGRTFDAVFVHDAVCYLTTETDLRRAMDTAFVHCRPGGAVLFAPDFDRETFRTGTSHGGRDDGPRGLRYLEWRWDPDPDDTTYLVDYAFLLREADGVTRVVQDRHVEGLFARATWLRLLAAAGFEAHAEVVRHEGEPGLSVTFVGRRPA